MGAGKSGIAAYKLLKKTGAESVLFDENKELDKEALKNKLEDSQATIYAGELPEEVKASSDLLVMSPGIPVDTPFVDSFKNKNIQ
jgi:UDP-N-acetylmuramoylalanine--D-glutamate ligase